MAILVQLITSIYMSHDYNCPSAQVRIYGAAEVWWESLEDLTAALSTAEGRQADRALREDERRFIDLERSTACLVEEQVVIA